MALRPLVGPALCGSHNHHDGHEGQLGWDEGRSLPGFRRKDTPTLPYDCENGRVASATLRLFKQPRNDCTTATSS